MSDDTNPTLWYALIAGVGACAGAAATVVVGWFNLRSRHRDADNVAHEALLAAQNRMIDRQSEQVQQLQNQLTEAITQLSKQREFYDNRIDGIYRQLSEARSRCPQPEQCWRRDEDGTL